MAFKDDVGSLDRIATALEGLQGNTDIPTPTSQDSGKVLGVNAQGKYALTQGGAEGRQIALIGVEGAGTQTVTLNKTWKEIYDLSKTNFLLLDYGDETYYSVDVVTYVGEDDGTYYVTSGLNQITNEFRTDSENEYPQWSMN